MLEPIMLGINHLDPHGPERIKHTLERIQPEVVLAEGSEITLINGQRYTEHVREKLRSSDISRSAASAFMQLQDAEGYEQEVSKEYCERNGIPFYFFEDNQITLPAQGQLDQVLRAIKSGLVNPQKLLEENSIIVDQVYWALSLIQADPEMEKEWIRRNQEVFSKEMKDFKREEIMARRFHEIRSAHPGKRILTINGFYHTLIDPTENTLYCKLRSLNPKRVINHPEYLDFNLKNF